MSARERWFRALIFAILIASFDPLPAESSDRQQERAGNPLLLNEPRVVLDDEGVALFQWEIESGVFDRSTDELALSHLEEWRSEIERLIGGTSPEFLMRRNRQLFPWLEAEHPGQAEINREVERGEFGRVRAMNTIEACLLDYHASRYPLLERPSEAGALILSLGQDEGSIFRIYYLTDGDGLPPKGAVDLVLGLTEVDVESGWDARFFFHSHTFDLEIEKGLLAIAAPSESDLQFIRALDRRLDIEEAWIADGFSSFVMDVDDSGEDQE